MTMAEAPQFESKIKLGPTLFDAVALLPRPLVFTNGVFVVLHRGHVTYLAEARRLGQSLVVALNSDASARRLGKGPDRPINHQDDRCALIAALGVVDCVTLFEEDTPYQLIDLLRPASTLDQRAGETYSRVGHLKLVPLVETTRGTDVANASVENVHYGAVAVVDLHGQVLAHAGDPHYLTYTRSALKPLQAMPLVADQGIKALGLEAADLAMFCASHSGEPRHVDAASLT